MSDDRGKCDSCPARDSEDEVGKKVRRPLSRFNPTDSTSAHRLLSTREQLLKRSKSAERHKESKKEGEKKKSKLKRKEKKEQKSREKKKRRRSASSSDEEWGLPPGSDYWHKARERQTLSEDPVLHDRARDERAPKVDPKDAARFAQYEENIRRFREKMREKSGS